MPRVALLLACWLLGGVAVAAPQGGLRILLHQAVTMSSTGAGRSLQFDAYGRRFELQLERNERMRFVTATRTPGVEALRGSVVGAAGSWVRLTRTPAGLFGLLYDGQSHYAIEPAAAAAGHTVGPMQAKGSAPVIYRLADTLMPPGEASCTVVTLDDLPAQRARTAEQAIDGVAGELQALAATLPGKQIEVALVGDFEFSGLVFAGGLTPEAAIAARMNIVDGIYAAQVGVKVIVTDVNVFRTAGDPFTSTTVPSTLLNELASWRQVTPAQSARGLTHLLTGRDLDGTTVGIAFLGSVCNTRAAAGLTQGTLSTTNSALVIAHEIGHNFGAEHDGETGKSCEATAQTFLMAPRLNGSDQFSACSLGSITPVLNAARCIVALNIPDADLDLPASVRRLRGQAFDYTFNVRSVGGTGVDGLVATVTLPAGLVANASAVAGGNPCTPGGSTLTCSVGSLAPQATRAITLNLTPQQSGTPSLAVALTSTNDASAGNNTGQVGFTVDPSADLDVAVAAAPPNFVSGGTTQFTATVRHLAGDPVTDARLTFEVPEGLSVSAVGVNGLGCTLTGAALACAPTALTVGASQSVVLTLTGTSAGTRNVRAAIAATLGDPVSSNNSAQAAVDTTVQQVVVVSAGAGAGSGGGGGGGALEFGYVWALLGWWAARASGLVRVARRQCRNPLAGARGEPRPGGATP
jgi:hypothetical protein